MKCTVFPIVREPCHQPITVFTIAFFLLKWHDSKSLCFLTLFAAPAGRLYSPCWLKAGRLLCTLWWVRWSSALWMDFCRVTTCSTALSTTANGTETHASSLVLYAANRPLDLSDELHDSFECSQLMLLLNTASRFADVFHWNGHQHPQRLYFTKPEETRRGQL